MDGNKTLSCSITAPEEASTFDELLMRHTLTFADNLKELKNLSTQLYSAAEHFERSYSREDRKQLVVETAKEYVNNAIVNTVDHLGSVAYKVTNFLDEKYPEELREELRRSASVSTTHSGRSMTRDIQPYSKKSKPLFKALFTMLKQKRDGKPCR
ncbi:hypothetical protein RHGRI_019890 [Rhododendron griersonianum]|nr:hypothetical protein RHGRI_019890 [Rhododendron griersonianum]